MSSYSFQRSVLSSASNESPEEVRKEASPLSPMPFLVSRLYAPHYECVHFSPGAFRRQGTVLGQGATFSVEKHAVEEIGIGMLQNMELREQYAAKWPVVAIKRLRCNSHIPTRSFETIEKELILLMALRGHEHVVQMIGIGWETAPISGDYRLWPVLVTEFAESGSLAHLQSQDSKLPYLTKRRLCLHVAAGVKSLHQLHLIHGDLKSENVLVFGSTPNQFVAKLADFGYVPMDYSLTNAASGLSSHGKSTAAARLGTDQWNPPEPLDLGSKNHLEARDVYAWGLLVLRVMLDGRNPFGIPTTWERSAHGYQRRFSLLAGLEEELGDVEDDQKSETNSVQPEH
ncbi:hypothetical protein PV08_01978 [Exophiala spinifera]|uniref:Protein kinase domain-containing protein n=1 Tax=Exophiala spinifera TaxID=91928 RepID=A0A0D2BQW7_9EURO|nr:uncharacterized protein PV08_01978 [Exophiala spinifera]KIW21398.1 hypothetical protein PV08_01978 [Exophiala spinifera]